MTDAMCDRGRNSATAAGLQNVEVHRADAIALPFPDASVDVVISNGVLNLLPEKDKAFTEIRRVLRPSGRLQLADIVLDGELGEDVRRNIDLWTG
jgi:ubiquinone/menaquinone biosynthesis C-methylase UbiE